MHDKPQPSHQSISIRHKQLCWVIHRAPILPVRLPKQEKQPKLSPQQLAARLHEQASRLVVESTAPEDQDIVVLSDSESDRNEDEALADASLSLVGILAPCRRA